jgi:hypothetical protein
MGHVEVLSLQTLTCARPDGRVGWLRFDAATSAVAVGVSDQSLIKCDPERAGLPRPSIH